MSLSIKLACVVVAITQLTQHSHAYTSPGTAEDIIVQTRMDGPTLNWLLKKSRLILNQNTEQGDRFTGTTDLSPIYFTFDELLKDPAFQKFKTVFSSAFGRDLNQAKLRVTIPKLDYRVKNLTVDPKQLTIQDPEVFMQVQATIGGVDIKMPGNIQLDLLLPKTEKSNATKTEPTLETFLSATIDRPGIFIPETLPPYPFGLDLSAKREDQIRFSFDKLYVNEASEYVTRHQSQFVMSAGSNQQPFNINHITVNPVIVRLNQHSRVLDFDSFKPVIQSKINPLLISVLKQVANSLERNIGPRILRTIFSHSMDTQIGIRSEKLFSRYTIQKFSEPTKDTVTKTTEQQLLIGLMGEHCTPKNYETYKEECLKHETAYDAVRILSPDDQLRAKEEITESLVQKRSDLVFSIGESYVNRLLHTTVQAGLWTETLEENSLDLGEKGAFVVFDKNTKNPELILDLVYYDRVTLRFPLKISTEINLTTKKAPDGQKPDIPNIGIKIKKITSTAQEIINGLPQYELPSRLIPFVRRRIARMILEMASKIEGTTVLNMDLEQMRGVGIENSTLNISKWGRLNVLFKTESNKSLTQ